MAIDESGKAVVSDITRKENRMIGRVLSHFPFGEMYYIMGSLGKLLIVVRNGVQVQPAKDRPDGYLVYDLDVSLARLVIETNQFHVLELDLMSNKLTYIPDLGDRALF